MMKLSVIVSGLCFALPIVATAAETVVFTIPTGMDCTLDEALSAGYVSGCGSYAELCLADKIEIAGNGRLIIDKDLKTDGFDGEICVKNGAVLRVTVMGALGGTTKGTVVESGATLESKAAESGASKLDFLGESLTFAGTGVDGKGALKALSTEQQRNGVWGGTILTMSGDAMIYQERSTQIFPSEKANSLDMNGHCLTIVGSHKNNTLPYRAVISNPGDIVVENVHLLVRSVAVFPGGEEHVLTIGENGRLQLFDCDVSTSGNRTWKLSFPKNGEESALRVENGDSTWNGPVAIDRELSVTLCASLELSGAVTANRMVTFVGSANPHLTATFASDSTDVRGGVVADGVDVVFADMHAKIDALKLTNGGMVKIAPGAEDVRFYAGWNFGESSSGYEKWSDPYYKYSTYGSVTNKVVLDVSDLHNDVKCVDSLGTFYNGYIWNPDAESVTWRFASCSHTLAGLKVNGAAVITKQNQNEVAFGNAILRPGANKFEFYLATSKSVTRPCPDPSNSTTWTNGYGLAYSKTSTTSEDSADFVEFSDPGDGSLMRLAEEGTAYWDELKSASVCSRSISALSSAPGAGFDVGKDEVTVSVLTGFPRIMSSYSKARSDAVTVSTMWVVMADKVLEGAKFESDLDIVFGKDAVLSVENWKLLEKDQDYVIARSSNAIVGMPKISDAHNGCLKLLMSADGHTLSIRRVSRGVILVVR